ncbi:MAG: hypothetical protein ACTMIR_00450 [Cellulomonadaceae bacterium]
MTSTVPGRAARIALAGALPVLLVLSACSGAADDDAATTASPSGDGAPSEQAGGGPGPDPEDFGGGGLRGEIAAVSGDVAQVQDGESQTAVSWSADTEFTLAVTGGLEDVTVGSCVLASGGTDAAATTVVVSEPVDGECASAGFMPGGGGGFAPGDGGERPEGDAPTDAPSGEPQERPTDSSEQAGQGPGGSMVVGQVLVVDGTSVTVAAVSDTEQETTLEVDDTTTVTVQRAGSAQDVEVGRCASAQGEQDGSGAMAATVMTLSDAGADGCTTAMQGGAGRPGQGGPGAGGDGGDSDD